MKNKGYDMQIKNMEADINTSVFSSSEDMKQPVVGSLDDVKNKFGDMKNHLKSSISKFSDMKNQLTPSVPNFNVGTF